MFTTITQIFSLTIAVLLIIITIIIIIIIYLFFVNDLQFMLQYCLFLVVGQIVK